MKSITKYSLIILILFGAAYEVQGHNVQYILENRGKRLKRQPNNKELVSTFVENTTRNECLETQTAARSQTAKDNMFVSENSKIFSTKQNCSNAGPTVDAELSNTAKETSSGVIEPTVRRFSPTQKIYCRQITETELDSEGKLVDSIRHICAPLQTTTAPPTTTTTLPHFRRETNFGRRVTSTPKGINCRRVMNSELNDIGEIVDSVKEVCDPPTTTTTTTTTKKPILPTTTTAMPLVKVCRPVMDSYLNEEGKIIDAVAIYCKMEQVNGTV